MQPTSVLTLAQQPSVAHHFLADLRDIDHQKDRKRFRDSMFRLGEILAYELSKTLSYAPKTTQTPLDTLETSYLNNAPVLVAILRAALPLHQGMLNFLDEANCGFIGAFRHNTGGHEFDIQADYATLPPVEGKQVIVVDPMLATGRTIVQTIDLIEQQGNPQHVHIAAAIASPEGLAYVEQHSTRPYSLWLGAVDTHLNQHYYIVPGLGDAGDLSYGPKL